MTQRVLDRRWPGLDAHLPSLLYRVQTTLEERTKPRSYIWDCAICLDQGNVGACVGHGLAAEAAAVPVIWHATSQMAFLLYHEAQKVDQWAGEDYEGTSVLAGAKAYKNFEFCSEYRWCLDYFDVLASAGKGPLVIGINWYEDMFNPDLDGFIHIGGNLAGGHCLLRCGQKIVWRKKAPVGWNPSTEEELDLYIDLDKSYAVWHQSWGPNWGVTINKRPGRCKISLRDEMRLFHEDSEFCMITKRVKEHVVPNTPTTAVGPAKRAVRTGVQSGVAAVIIEFIEAFNIYEFTDRQYAVLLVVLAAVLSFIQNIVENKIGKGFFKNVPQEPIAAEE